MNSILDRLEELGIEEISMGMEYDLRKVMDLPSSVLPTEEAFEAAAASFVRRRSPSAAAAAAAILLDEDFFSCDEALATWPMSKSSSSGREDSASPSLVA